MKLTKSQLKKIIKEEITEALKVLSENAEGDKELGNELRSLRHSRAYMESDYDVFLRIIKQDKGYTQTEDELHAAYMAADPIKRETP